MNLGAWCTELPNMTWLRVRRIVLGQTGADQRLRREAPAVRAAALILVGALIGVLGWPAPASAGVVVDPAQVEQGGAAGVTFRVSNDSSAALMTQMEVQFPDAAPIGEVYPYSVPGWAPNLVLRTLDQPIEPIPGIPVTQVAQEIRWTAVDGEETRPGEVAELSFSINPVPNVDRLVFTLLQTYSDGAVVRWADSPAKAGEPTPTHPAPALTVVRSSAAGGTPGSVAEGRPDGAAVKVPVGHSGAGAIPAVLAAMLAVLVLVLTVTWPRQSESLPGAVDSADDGGTSVPAEGLPSVDTSGFSEARAGPS